jgi:hypothetical protein
MSDIPLPTGYIGICIRWGTVIYEIPRPPGLSIRKCQKDAMAQILGASELERIRFYCLRINGARVHDYTVKVTEATSKKSRRAPWVLEYVIDPRAEYYNTRWNARRAATDRSSISTTAPPPPPCVSTTASPSPPYTDMPVEAQLARVKKQLAEERQRREEVEKHWRMLL